MNGRHTARGHQNPKIRRVGNAELARRTRQNAQHVGWRTALAWLFREGRATKAPFQGR